MWWLKYGFQKDPLEIRPTENILDREDIISKIYNAMISGKIIMIYGPIGSGKTSILLYLRKKLNKSRNFLPIYLNGEENRNPDLLEIMEKYLYKKIFVFKFRKKNKKIILLLDEFNNFSKDFVLFVKALYDKGDIYGIIISQVSKNIENAPPSFIDRIYEYVYVDFPDEEIMRKIIRYRLREKVKIDDRTLNRLITLGNRNPRKIFMLLSKYLSGEEILQENKSGTNIAETKVKKNIIKISSQQQKILFYLLKQDLTIKELAELTGLPYNSVSKQISRLLKKGIIEKVVDNNIVKYKLSQNYYKEIENLVGK